MRRAPRAKPEAMAVGMRGENRRGPPQPGRRNRAAAALCPGVLGLHPQSLPLRPPKGLAAVTATATSTNVLTLGFAFGPTRQPTTPPVLRPLLTSPRRAAAARPPPSHPPADQ